MITKVYAVTLSISLLNHRNQPNVYVHSTVFLMSIDDLSSFFVNKGERWRDEVGGDVSKFPEVFNKILVGEEYENVFKYFGRHLDPVVSYD